MLTRIGARARATSDHGFTIAEMSVAIALLSLLGSILAVGVLSTHKAVRITTDETQGLEDVRTASERLARDIRDARGVTVNDPNPAYNASQSQLTVWIDYNSDYVQSADETITWQLMNAGDGHFNMVRSVKSGGQVVEARTLVSNLAFTYCLASGACTSAPTSTNTDIRSVSVDMTYDAVIGSATSSRHVTFQVRLRNVA